jgi:hypothetical protein
MVVIMASFGRAVEASHLPGTRASQLPAAPANNSLRDIFMGQDTTIFNENASRVELGQNRP